MAKKNTNPTPGAAPIGEPSTDANAPLGDAVTVESVGAAPVAEVAPAEVVPTEAVASDQADAGGLDASDTEGSEADAEELAEGFLDAHAVPHGRHRDYMAGQIKAIKKPADLDAFLDEFANSDAKRTAMRKQLVAITGVDADAVK